MHLFIDLLSKWDMEKIFSLNKQRVKEILVSLKSATEESAGLISMKNRS